MQTQTERKRTKPRTAGRPMPPRSTYEMTPDETVGLELLEDYCRDLPLNGDDRSILRGLAVWCAHGVTGVWYLENFFDKLRNAGPLPDADP